MIIKRWRVCVWDHRLLKNHSKLRFHGLKIDSEFGCVSRSTVHLEGVDLEGRATLHVDRDDGLEHLIVTVVLSKRLLNRSIRGRFASGSLQLTKFNMVRTWSKFGRFFNLVWSFNFKNNRWSSRYLSRCCVDDLLHNVRESKQRERLCERKQLELCRFPSPALTTSVICAEPCSFLMTNTISVTANSQH